MERALYNYHDNKLKRKELIEIVLNGSPSMEIGMPSNPTQTSVTETKAIKLMEDAEIKELEKEIKKVDNFIKTLNDIEILVIELKYFRLDLNNRQIASILKISETKLYDILRKIKNG